MKRILVFVIIFSLLLSSCSYTTEPVSNNVIEAVGKTLRKEFGIGTEVSIAVIDSGTSLDKQNSEYALDFSEEGSAIDFIDHGVPIANIISNKEYGLAPGATVYSLKVINEYGNASTQSVYNALEWCLNNSIDIINMSLSFGLYSENIECIIDELVQQGVIIVASISNVDKEVDYPSMYNDVICVGRTASPELYAKDRSVIFLENYPVRTKGCNDEFKDYAGNSFLTPVVTGIIACLIDKTNIERSVSHEELIRAVKSILSTSDFQTM